jgi:hypothetical protein
MGIDLKQLRRQSQLAATLTAVASIIILVSLIFSYRQTIQAKRDLSQLQAEVENKKDEKERLEREIKELEEQKTALVTLTNGVVSKSPNAAKFVKETVAASPSIASAVPRIYIQTPRPTASSMPFDPKGLSSRLRSAGFIVPTTEIVSSDSAPDKTQLRYFSDGPTAQKDVNSIADILRSAGLKVQPTLVKTLPGASQPLPRTYEVWFGKSDSSKRDFSQFSNAQLAELAINLAMKLREIDARHFARDSEIRKSFQQQAAANGPEWRAKNAEEKFGGPIMLNIKDLGSEYYYQYQGETIALRDEILTRLSPAFQRQYREKDTNYYYNARNDSDTKLYHDLKFAGDDLEQLATYLASSTKKPE